MVGVLVPAERNRRIVSNLTEVASMPSIGLFAFYSWFVSRSLAVWDVTHGSPYDVVIDIKASHALLLLNNIHTQIHSTSYYSNVPHPNMQILSYRYFYPLGLPRQRWECHVCGQQDNIGRDDKCQNRREGGCSHIKCPACPVTSTGKKILEWDSGSGFEESTYHCCIESGPSHL